MKKHLFFNGFAHFTFFRFQRPCRQFWIKIHQKTVPQDTPRTSQSLSSDPQGPSRGSPRSLLGLLGSILITLGSSLALLGCRLGLIFVIWNPKVHLETEKYNNVRLSVDETEHLACFTRPALCAG